MNKNRCYREVILKSMCRLNVLTMTAALIISGAVSAAPAEQANRKVRRLGIKEYVDKMKAGWIGQMAGVGYGAPTEFGWQGCIIPETRLPQWTPETINQTYHQDDLYVEMTFLRTLELYGLDVSIRQAGIDFAQSGYPLAHANAVGRNNLLLGIAPPDSGHPKFSTCADDIDYQIEADFSGLISPGLGNSVVQLGEKFGRLMNYGDGLYGGQFVGGMYAEAFFENDIENIIKAGLACIPTQSQYYECITDVLRWYKENPSDWMETWWQVQKKYQIDPNYRRHSCNNNGGFNIDAKINGAYIVIGMLYGNGDPDKTIVISTRCGQDSDCNPSSAAGILFTTMGFLNLPDKFTSAIKLDTEFMHTPYTFPKLIEVCETLAGKVVTRGGGQVEKDTNGENVFFIPVEKIKPSKLQKSWKPDPIANSKYTEAEMEDVLSGGTDLSDTMEKFAPGWKASKCAGGWNMGLQVEWNGRQNVLMTHPLTHKTACEISRKVEITAGKKTSLQLLVGHQPNGKWDLAFKADDVELLKRTVSKTTAQAGWLKVNIDLSELAGKTVNLQLFNQAGLGYWGDIRVMSDDL